MRINILAPAKINLYLEVLKRAPGENLHKIETIMQTVSLFDSVSVECKKNNTSKNKIDIFTNSKDLNGLPKFKNLAYVACNNFLEISKIHGFSLNIKISKNIPIGAGLAGGSSDAAAVLKGLNYIFKDICKESKLKEIAKNVGTDVPFLLSGGTVVAKEVGTQIRKIKNLKNFYIVICKPSFEVFTKEAYKAFDEKYQSENYEKNGIEEIIKSINEEDIQGASERLYNRFEKVINSNEIVCIKKVIKQNGALAALMSGSGSSVFGIFKEKREAIKCFETLKKIYKNVFLCEPVNFGCKILSKR